MGLGSASLRDLLVFALALLVLAWRIRKLVQAACQVRWLQACRTSHAMMFHFFHTWRGQRTQRDDLVGRLVVARMRQWEVQRFRFAVQVGAIVSALFSFLHVVNILQGTKRSSSLSQDAAFYLSACIFVLLEVWPRFITPRCIRCVYVVCLFAGAASNAPGQLPADLIFVQGMYLKLFMLILNGATLQVTIVAFGTFLLSATWITHILVVDVSDVTPLQVRGWLMLEAAWGTAMVCFSWTLQRSVQASLQKDIEAKMSQGEQSAVSSLLNMVCDVVIELDAQLRLVGPSRTLCDFLLRGSTQTLEGASFLDLLPKEEDRAMFDQGLPSDSGAHSVRFNLRDGNGTLIQVDMFHSCFEGPDGKCRYFAGLSECRDNGPPAARLPSEFAGRCLTSQGHISEDAFMEATQMVVVDSTDPNLPIIEVSEGLEHLTGVAAGNHFIRCVGSSREFTIWLQEEVNKFLDGREDAHHQHRIFAARLRPRLDSAKTHLCASCTATMYTGSTSIAGEGDGRDGNGGGNADQEDGTNLNVVLEVHNIVRRHGNFRSRSGSSRRRTLRTI